MCKRSFGLTVWMESYLPNFIWAGYKRWSQGDVIEYAAWAGEFNARCDDPFQLGFCTSCGILQVLRTHCLQRMQTTRIVCRECTQCLPRRVIEYRDVFRRLVTKAHFEQWVRRINLIELIKDEASGQSFLRHLARLAFFYLTMRFPVRVIWQLPAAV